MKPNAEQLNDVLSAAETATEQQCDDWLRLLLTGDDGSVAASVIPGRDVAAIYTWAARRKYEILRGHSAFAAGGVNTCLIDSRGLLLWSDSGQHQYMSSGEAARTVRHDLPPGTISSDLEAHVAAYREPATCRHWADVMDDCRNAGVRVWAVPHLDGEWNDAYEVYLHLFSDDDEYAEDCNLSDLQLVFKRISVIGLARKAQDSLPTNAVHVPDKSDLVAE